MNYRCPIATIITPAYKKSDMIFQTIDSIVSQTYPNIEYIIVDDGPNAIDQECVRKYILNNRYTYI